MDADRLMEALRALPHHRSSIGDEANQEGLAETEKLLVERLSEMGYDPTLQPLPLGQDQLRTAGTGDRNHPWHNIIVELPGQDLKDEVLVIGAHFDAVTGSPGADDNGTGTAALLELARVLKAVPMRRTVRMIFFNLEEVGLVGSAAYVRQLTAAPGWKKEGFFGMISLEMLGYFSDEPGSQRSPFAAIPGVYEPPSTGDFIAIATIQSHEGFSRRLAREMSAAEPELNVLVVDFFPAIPADLLRSDHAPFLLADLPGVIITDTGEYRNPHYHRATDTTDTIDPDRFAHVVRALAGAAHAIAEPVTAVSD